MPCLDSSMGSTHGGTCLRHYYFLLSDRNGGLILRTEVDVTDAMRPDRLEVSLEVSNTFERYIRELRADRDWEAGSYRADPDHPGRPTNFLVWEPAVYTGTESYVCGQSRGVGHYRRPDWG